jgi:hypothetical protein
VISVLQTVNSFPLIADRSLLACSYPKTRQEASSSSAGDSHSNHLLQTVLSKESILRDGPVHCHRCMLLCCGQGRGVPHSHQDGRIRGSFPVQSYVLALFSDIRKLIRYIHSDEPYNVKHFLSDASKLAEMEFYLMDDLECDLTVFHPYRSLLALCCREGAASVIGTDAEAGELGAGVDDGPRYWGSGEGKLELNEGALQMAWCVRRVFSSELVCLLVLTGSSSTILTGRTCALSTHRISLL